MHIFLVNFMAILWIEMSELCVFGRSESLRVKIVDKLKVGRVRRKWLIPYNEDKPHEKIGAVCGTGSTISIG